METAGIMFEHSPEIMNGYALLDEIGFNNSCELEVCGYLIIFLYVALLPCVQPLQEIRAKDAFHQFIDCTCEEVDRVSVFVIHRNLILYLLSR